MDNLFDKYGGISLLTLAKGCIICSTSRFQVYGLSNRLQDSAFEALKTIP